MKSRRAVLWQAVCALAACWFLAGETALAENWPVFRHDNQRSAVSAEELKLPLGAAWTRTSVHPPQGAWPLPAAQNVYRHMRNLQATRASDTAFHPVVAGGKLYYGSSADDTLYCVDVASGATLWWFATEGPIRLAPAVAGGKVYVGSDDGRVYCLDAATGRLIWKIRGGPEDHRLAARRPDIQSQNAHGGPSRVADRSSEDERKYSGTAGRAQDHRLDRRSAI